ncbi:hydrogenase maturation protease [Polaribacter sp. MSW13]|uniref:Hydrogenase maturation protease n=1 Tax=Polaribacter marinus TaxID=2916838 RepID=A0A9X2AIM9_9FLAO|nr:hydrogenase maturation protease [Polaribacter marinus]MCI2228252.1 hydrogenase maturation protease [Polaribacter marinus]
MEKIAIMGFGNPVRSDDGIGMYVIEKLKEIIGNNSSINIFDMGTAAFEILFGLKGHQKIILVDAVINSNEPVGTLFKVPASEVLAAPEENPLVFLHSMKWNQALSYAKKILQDEYPEDIQVYLIAVENTKLEFDLSKEVQDAGDKVVNLILEELKPLVIL